MTKKKLIITITSLCLVVVAAVAAVVGILAAQQVSITSSLKVTYTPGPEVIATVKGEYAVNGATATAIGPQNFVYGGETASFAINIDEITLKDDKPYVIFAFSFQNDAVTENTNSQVLHVVVPTVPGATNLTVTPKYKKVTTTSGAPLTSLTKTAFEGLTDADSSANITSIGIGETGYMYVMVEIQSGKQGLWEANTGFSFTLTASKASA